MRIEKIDKDQLTISQWSGGTTTQLYIYPEGSSYKNLDFIFRLSTATVNVEESTFTSLPNVSRIIMLLDGELKLEHENHYTKHLRKFETDSFLGSWKTKGMGKATDFNLMLREGATGQLEGFNLKKDSDLEVTFEKFNTTACYLLKGNASLIGLNQKIILQENELVVIFPDETLKRLSINSKESSEIVLAKIKTK